MAGTRRRHRLHRVLRDEGVSSSTQPIASLLKVGNTNAVQLLRVPSGASKTEPDRHSFGEMSGTEELILRVLASDMS